MSRSSSRSSNNILRTRRRNMIIYRVNRAFPTKRVILKGLLEKYPPRATLRRLCTYMYSTVKLN